jgi:hypothetical protein
MSETVLPPTRSLHSSPLYTTAKALRKRSAEGDAESLGVLEAVEYHVDAAASSSDRCWELAGGTDVILMGKPPPELIPSQRVQLLRNGDEAIREAVSAVDMALQAVNHILQLGVPAHKVTPDSVLAVLGIPEATEPKSTRERIAAAIQTIARSMLLSGLRAYRNWVTHRGAPRISAATAPSGDGEPDSPTSLDSLEVTCYPFVPPVLTRRLREPIQIPQLTNPVPIRLSDGGLGFPIFQIEIQGGRISVGGLEMNADEYAEKNPQSIEVRRVKVAGEELAVYRARDFVRGVQELVWRLQTNLAEGSNWDNALSAAVD